jgi:hypothetical protein
VRDLREEESLPPVAVASARTHASLNASTIGANRSYFLDAQTRASCRRVARETARFLASCERR